MRLKETLSNTQLNGHSRDQVLIEADPQTLKLIEELGDDHVGTSIETPMRQGAFDMSDEEKIREISGHFRQIMEILGLDLNDDSLSGTPMRVAKMYVKEIFQGLDPKNRPSIKLFDNKYKYGEMLIEKEISFYSNCEHHFVPIVGKAHVAYISGGKVIGLSKLNRIVRYYAQRPQVQERLTEQIAADLKETLQTEDVAVIIDAKHLCVSMRGVEDDTSSTITAHYGGKFANDATKRELLHHISKG